MSGRTEGGNVEHSPGRNKPIAIALACALQPLLTSPAFAHASDRGFVLLLPTGYYIAGGALAVAASFLVLLLLPPRLLERVAASRLTLGAISEHLRSYTGFAGFLVLLALIAAGFLGSRDPLSNPLPLIVWTLLWVGLTLLQGLFGDIWRWINPWHAPARFVGKLLGREQILRMPRAVSSWPAVLLFFAFAWFELIYPAPDDPYRLACVAAAYSVFTITGAVTFGVDHWFRSCEPFSVFFGMVARFGILDRDKATGSLSLRWPGAKLWDTSPLPLSSVFFLLLALASVSFDGFSKTFFWLGLNGINPLEYPGRTALMVTNTIGLVLTFGVLALAFVAAVWLGEKLLGEGSHDDRGWIAGLTLLVWSIVPIALAYHFSHYLTSLLINSQYALVAISDPFALGWNLFGTAYWPVSAGIAAGSDAAWMLWNAQAAAIIGGHVLAVLAAHGLAFRLHGDTRRAALSQLPLTILMIGYTVLGLWLLSTPTAG